MRNVVIVLLCAVLVSGSREAWAANEGVRAVCNGSSIAVSYSGINPGTIPIVQISRQNLTDCGPWVPVASGIAPPGQQIELSTVDTDVIPDKLYRYSITPDQWNAPLLGVTFFDDFAGCGNPPVAEGSVVLVDDGAAVYTVAVPCPGSCYPEAALWSGGNLVTDYLDGDPVTIYGSLEWTLHLGWVIFATSAEPGDCTTIGVEARPWTRIKQMYR